jgi:hypothetical protein
MAWTNIANANLQVGAPLRSVDILALRDNVSAVPNGDSGAPRIKAAALDGGQSGAAPIYAARAWVNFDGTTSPGTIRASGNVSSVARNGTGDYTVNFTTAMPDANYSGVCTADRVPVNQGFVHGAPVSASAFYVRTYGSGGAAANYNIVQVSIFR